MFVGNGSSLPSFPFVKVRKNRLEGFTRQANPISPGSDAPVFLCELSFVLRGLCDEIGPRNFLIRASTLSAGILNPEPGTRNPELGLLTRSAVSMQTEL